MKGLAVVLISYVVYASEECAAERTSKGDGRNCEYNAPIECYECSTQLNDQYCADPFNETHPELRIIRCYDYCAKWVRKPKIGEQHVIRTCSTNLNIQMPVASVCMKESRPGDGHLCFCKKGRCNSAPASTHQASKLPAILLSLLGLLLLQTYFSGYTNVARWRSAPESPPPGDRAEAADQRSPGSRSHRDLDLGQVTWRSEGRLIGDAAALENG